MLPQQIDNYNVIQHSVNQELQIVDQGLQTTNPISIDGLLYADIIFVIFSHLDLASLSTSCLISRKWEQLASLASQPVLWKHAVYKELAFGNDKWAQ
jgi:hypothetical protein